MGMTFLQVRSFWGQCMTAISVVLFLGMSPVGADPVQEDRLWQEVFERTFVRDYRRGRCGGNVFELLKEAKRQGLDLRSAQVIRLKNEGNSAFGMVNAEWAREAGGKNPNFPRVGPSRLPGEKNWDFHVLLVRSGRVYDLDFGNEPQTPEWMPYLEKMFLSEAPGSAGFFVGKARKLSDYRATLIAAEVFLQSSGEFLQVGRWKTVTLAELNQEILHSF